MSITFLTVSVVYFWKTSVSNSDSLLFYERLFLYPILSGLDRCCTCNFMLIKSCLTISITTVDMAPWPFFLVNLSLSLPLPLSLIPWRTVFEYCVQVFPCVHTLEDGAQAAHPVIFPDNQVFLSFTASTATIVRNPSWGSSGCLTFVTWSATPHFVAFFSFVSDLWFLQQAFGLVVDPTYHS